MIQTVKCQRKKKCKEHGFLELWVNLKQTQIELVFHEVNFRVLVMLY